MSSKSSKKKSVSNRIDDLFADLSDELREVQAQQVEPQAVGPQAPVEPVVADGLAPAQPAAPPPYSAAAPYPAPLYPAEASGRGIQLVTGQDENNLRFLPAENPLGRAALQSLQTQKPSYFHAPDASIAVPFHIGTGGSETRPAPETGLGLLEILDDTPNRRWAEDELRLVEQVTDQLALALENARLFQETQTALSETQTLYGITRAATRSFELEEILDDMLSQVLMAVGFHTGLITILDDEKNQLELAAHQNLPPQILSAFQKQGLQGTLCHLTFQRQAPIFIEDLSSAPVSIPQSVLEGPRRAGFRSYQGIPLISKGLPLGTLCLFNLQPSLGPAQASLLQASSQQISIAIENSRLYRQEQRRRQIADTLRNIAQVVGSTLDVTQVTELMLDQLPNLIEFNSVSIHMVQGNTRTLLGGRGFDVEADLANPSVLHRPLDEDPLIQQAVDTRQPVLLSDTHEDPRWQILPQTTDVRSWIAAPMVAGGEVVGLLIMDHMSPGYYTQEVASLAMAFTAQAGVAIRNARLFQEIQASYAETGRLYQATSELNAVQTYDQIIQILRSSTVVGHPDAAAVSIYLFDRPWAEEHRPEFADAIARWNANVEAHELGTARLGTAQELYSTQASPAPSARVPLDDLFPPDVSHDRLNPTQPTFIEGLLYSPLNVGGQWIGQIVVSYSQPILFTPQELRPLTALSGQAAVAIQNIRLLQETSRRALQLTTAAEISRDTSSTLSLDAILQRAVNAIRDRYNYYHASIFLLDETGLNLVVRESTGSAGEEMKQRHHSLRVGSQSIVGLVAANGQPLVVNDTGQSPMHRPNPLLPDTHAELGIPLKSADRVIGVLDVQSNQVDAFSQDDITILQTLADQLANAIQNARLFQDRRQAEEALAVERNTLRTLIDVIPDLIYFKDTGSRMLLVNTAQVRLLGGSTHEDLIGKTDLEFFPEELGRKYYDDEQQIIRSGQAIYDMEEPTIDPDGTPRWTLTTKIPLRDARGQVYGIVGIGRNITALKTANMERERLLGEVERRAVQLQAAAQVARATSSILDPDQLLQQAVNLVRDRFNLYYVGLFLIEEVVEPQNLAAPATPRRFAALRAGTGAAGQAMLARRHRLEIRTEEGAVPSASPAVPGASGALSASAQTSMIAWCIANRHARIALDVGQDSVRFENPLLPETRSELALPLLSRGQPIGAMTVQSSLPEAFSDEDVAVLQTLADQIAVAVDNARSFALAQQAIAETRQRVQEISNLYDVSQAVSGATMQSEEIASIVAEKFLQIMPVEYHVDRSTIFFYDTEGDLLLSMADVSLPPGDDAGAEERAPVHTYEQRQLVLEEYPSIEQVMQSLQPYVLNAASPELSPSEEQYMHTPDASGVPGLNGRVIANLIFIPLAVKGQSIGVIELQSHLPGPTGDLRLPPPRFTLSEQQSTLFITMANAAAVALENARLYEEQIETAEQLRELDRLKSQFLANMSHELRTPLNSIIGFSRVILKGIDGAITELQQQDLTAIHNAGTHLLQLINDVLDISKIEAGKMELAFDDHVNIADIITSAMSTAVGLTKDKPIKLERSIEPDLPFVRADPTRIRQVIINFLSNAAKFTDEGVIKVTAECTTGPHGRPEIMVSVTDSGPGISEEDQNKLFKAFSQVDSSPTRKVGGTGLGLSISRLLVDLHNGRIGVHSEVGKGSTFYFTIPVPIVGEPEPLALSTAQARNDAPAVPGGSAVPGGTLGVSPAEPSPLGVLSPVETQNEAPAVPSGSAQPSSAPKEERTVLIIDDDRQVVKLYQRYLQEHGFKTVSLNEPLRALEVVKEIQPYAITLDVMMPRKDGWQVLQSLKDDPATRHIPVIVCSIVEDQEKGFSLGAVDYLTKPILEDDLVKALTRLNGDGNIREVLVVDDDPDDLRLVQRILEEANPTGTPFKVRIAHGGAEGLVEIQTNPPQAIVLDLFMPDLDGFTLLETVRSEPHLRDIPVIIFTAGVLTDEQQQRLADFSQMMLHKGEMGEEELLAAIENVLRRINPAPPYPSEGTLGAGPAEVPPSQESDA